MSIENVEPTLDLGIDKKESEEIPEGVEEPQPYAPHYLPDDQGKIVKTVTDAEWKKKKANEKALSDAALARVKKDLPWNQPGNRA